MSLYRESSNKQERKNASKFMQEAPGVINNMINIANKGQTQENKQRAKEILKQIANRIEIMCDNKIISKDEANDLVNQMEGYI